MPKTKDGIYHNLIESEYIVEFDNVFLFFSSMIYKNKFINGYQLHREKFIPKARKLLLDYKSNLNFLSDMVYYSQIEKRGYFVRVKSVNLKWNELQRYAYSRMNDTVIPVWEETTRNNLRRLQRNYR